VHRFAIARAAPHPGHVRPYLSAYGVKPAGDALRCLSLKFLKQVRGYK
jgi:hypothetical protein